MKNEENTRTHFQLQTKYTLCNQLTKYLLNDDKAQEKIVHIFVLLLVNDLRKIAGSLFAFPILKKDKKECVQTPGAGLVLMTLFGLSSCLALAKSS